MTRRDAVGVGAAIGRAGSARSPAWIVTDGLAIASRYQRRPAPLTERTKTSSPSTMIQMIVRWGGPSGRAVSISISSVVGEQGELVGIESHGASVAHLGSDPTMTARFRLQHGCNAATTFTAMFGSPCTGCCDRHAVRARVDCSRARTDDESGRVRHHVISYQEVTVSTQPLVLVADDEPRITKLVSIALGEEGFRVVTAGSGEEALAKAEEVRPDIVLLDIVMPDLDGIEVMRQLRERRPVAVILLTAKGSTADKAKGLDLGADDYIAKPFHPDELAARVRAVLRRSSGAQPGSGVLKFDDVEIDLERRMVTRNGELVQLSRTEWLLLQHLAANAGKVVLHTELLTKVWGPEYRDDLQYLRVWVSRVRRKLGAEPGEPGRIKTFQGIGYLLDVEPPVAAGDRRRRSSRTSSPALIG